jgi:hypothetical protein
MKEKSDWFQWVSASFYKQFVGVNRGDAWTPVRAVASSRMILLTIRMGPSTRHDI